MSPHPYVKRTACAVMASLALAISGQAQDLVAVAPRAATVEYEDARVRVVRLRMAPHTSSPMHDRPARVVIPLTPNDVRITRTDGTTSATRTDAHRPAWSEPAKREVTNLATALENIIVELKSAPAPAQPLQSPPVSRPPGYLDEPRHRWLFENQYVRVYEVRIPPGAESAFHMHAFDAVVIFVSGGRVATQTEGEPWGPTDTIQAGSIRFAADARTPYTHRVRNDGSGEYHVILVQLLPPR